MKTLELSTAQKGQLDQVYIKTPSEIAGLRYAFQRDLEAGSLRSLSFGVPSIDGVVKTIWGGRLMSIIARPSSWKTSLMVHMARVEAARILAAGTQDREYVLFVSLEEDEVDISHALTGDPSPTRMLAGEYDPLSLAERSARAVECPVWIAGYTPADIAHALLGEDNLPGLTLQQLEREIGRIAQTERGYGMRPSAIFCDYLQIFDIEGVKWGDNRRNDAVGQVMIGLKKLAQKLRCPIVVGVQAKESVDDQALPVPQLNGCYYSSEIGHASDIALSLYYPCRYDNKKHDGWIEDRYGVQHPVSPNLLWVQLLKQRKSIGRAHWLVDCDPAEMRVGELGSMRAGLLGAAA